MNFAGWVFTLGDLVKAGGLFTSGLWQLGWLQLLGGLFQMQGVKEGAAGSHSSGQWWSWIWQVGLDAR